MLVTLDDSLKNVVVLPETTCLVLCTDVVDLVPYIGL